MHTDCGRRKLRILQYIFMNKGTGMRALDMNKLSWQRNGVSKRYKLFIN